MEAILFLACVGLVYWMGEWAASVPTEYEE